MTLFKSEHHSQRRTSMTGELRSSRPKAGIKRGSSDAYRCDYEKEYEEYPDDHCDRVFDYQRVPASVTSVPAEINSPVKRARPSSSPSSSSSSSSSSSAVRRLRGNRPTGKSSAARTGTAGAQAKLKMAELLAIKRELTVIKVQIDGLLDCVDKMDRQRTDQSDSPPTREGSVADSPRRGGSVSSLENSPVGHPHRLRDSPEPGEASDEDDHPRYHQYYYHNHYSHHRINNHHSDMEDDM